MKTLPALPALLFRQRLLLAVLAGAVCLRDVPLGIGLLVLLLVVMPGERPLRRMMSVAAFVLGLCVVFLAEPKVPDCPSWAAVPGRNVLAEGRVVSATGLPGGRVRVLLENLHPLKDIPPLPGPKASEVRKALARSAPYEASAAGKGFKGKVVEDHHSPVPGLVSMTLDARALAVCSRPMQGQRMRALMRLYPAGGSVNPGVSDIAAYWADRRVWHRAALSRSRNSPLFVELLPGNDLTFRLSLLRERWRAELEQALASPESRVSSEEGNDSRAVRASSDDKGTFVAPLSQGRAMLVALLFGDRSLLSPETVDIFNRAGLVHSLALSGQHLVLAAMAGAALILGLSHIFHGLFLVRPKRILVLCAGIPFALVYLFLGGAPLSLLRAAFMMLAATFFLCLRRATASLDVLFAAAFLLFVFRPLIVFDLSAQLSVLAVAGIMLVMPVVSALVRRFPSREKSRGNARFSLPRRMLYGVVRWAGTMLLLSCAAQLAVLPVLVLVFGAVSLNVWMNLLWLPLLTLVTLPCAALGLVLLIAFGGQAVSSLLFAVAAYPADAVLALLSSLAHGGWLPFVQCLRPSSLSCLGYGAVLAAAALAAQAALRRTTVGAVAKRLLVAGLVCMPVGQMPVWLDELSALREERVTLTVFDVGQGQALLLEYPGGRMLVDGGGSTSPFFDVGRSILAPALTQGKLPRLDAVLVSHTDMDHARGLGWILEHFTVGALYWSPFSAQDGSPDGDRLSATARRRGIPERLLSRGDALDLPGGLRLEVLWPDMESVKTLHRKKEASRNEASLALRLTRNGEGLVLLCGDMTSSALGRLVETGQPLRAGVLVLPHHGAASSFQKTFYDAVHPEAALASAAPFRSRGFPSRKVREEMDKRGIPLFSTSQSGALRVTWAKDGGMDIRTSI